MATCNTCGNTWEPIMQIRIGNRSMQFDCFECAITALAPRCSTCGSIIIGHGVVSPVNAATETCCSEHCARIRARTAAYTMVGQVTLDEAIASSFPASDPASIESPH